MGYLSPLGGIDDAKRGISIAGTEVCSPYTDGYNGFEIKKQLWLLKFQLDELIAQAPTFVGENEFIEECEKEKMWKTLKV